MSPPLQIQHHHQGQGKGRKGEKELQTDWYCCILLLNQVITNEPVYTHTLYLPGGEGGGDGPWCGGGGGGGEVAALQATYQPHHLIDATYHRTINLKTHTHKDG